MKNIADPLYTFFNRIATIEGTLYHLQQAMNRESKDYVARMGKIKHKIPDFALGTNLIISDITGPTDNGWEYNYPTSGQYEVKLSNYKLEVDQLINRESAYSVSQSFEVFTSFLKDIVIAFFSSNPNRLKDLSKNSTKVVEDLLGGKRYLRLGKNQKELFKILRKTAPNLGTSEVNNNKNINIPEWYNGMAFFRNAIIHSRGQFCKEDNNYNQLSQKSKDYLIDYFPYSRVKNEEYAFQIDGKKARYCLKLLSEYAFLIFKEISISINYEWRILKDMKK